MCTGIRPRLMKKLKSNLISKDTFSRLYQIPVPIIGLTGGIATGKSTVAQYFKDLDVCVIDADQLVKAIYSKNSSLVFIQTHFPDAIINNAIHFKTLRELAFLNFVNQQIIEQYIYAQMPEAFQKAYSELPSHEVIVYDVPLLFEKKLDTLVDLTLCIYLPENIQVERLINRDHIEKSLAKNILSKQMSIEVKKTKSQFVISNTSSLDELKNQFNNFCHQIFE